MARIAGYAPAAGQQNPGKYAFVGNNYKQYGEQAGFIYDPYTDQYYRDPRTTYEQYKKEGLVQEPKKQTLAGSLVPVGLAAGTMALATEGGKAIPGAVKGLFGLGETANTAGEAISQGASAASSAGSAGGQGLFGFGSTAPSYSLGVSNVGDVGSPMASTITDVPANSFNYGNLAQGVGGGLQALQGYKEFKGGNKVGGLLHLGAGAANIGSAAGLEAATPFAAPLTAGAGLYGTYQGIKSGSRRAAAMGGAEAGAGIGTMIAPGIGTALGAGIGLLAGGALGHIKTGKSQDQQGRDKIREALQGMGMADDKFAVKLANGQTFDIGLDGKHTLTNSDGKTTRRAYEADMNNPLSQVAIQALAPKAQQIVGDDAKGQNWLVGMLANAATNNAKTDKDVLANIDSMFQGVTLPGQSQPAAQNAGPVVKDNEPTRNSSQNVNRTSQTMNLEKSAALKNLLKKGAFKDLTEK